MFTWFKRFFTRKDDLEDSLKILFGEYYLNEEGEKIAIKTKRVMCPNGHDYVVEHGNLYPESCKKCGLKDIYMPPVCVVMHPYYTDEKGNVLKMSGYK